MVGAHSGWLDMAAAALDVVMCGAKDGPAAPVVALRVIPVRERINVPRALPVMARCRAMTN
jgi:hypothetical protein